MTIEPDQTRSPLTIGITMGDPAGIGPETIVKALADESLRNRARFIIYGLHEPFAYAADLAELHPYWTRVPHEEALACHDSVVVADFDEIAIEGRPIRQPTAEQGRASIRFLDQAIADARHDRIQAIVTAPIHKSAWKLAGVAYPGHTEYLAHCFRSRRVAMMFTGGPLRVALASVHEPLFELRNSFTIGRVFQAIDLFHQALRDWFDIPVPKIAACGLNPHAGENGQFGDEEIRVIQPALDMARHAGIHAEGPFPADTLFLRAVQGEFDGVVAMYHDQALIPVKLLAFDRAVNITLGLPVVRTSPDHGTAYDIAGKNLADPGSLKSAIKMALELAGKRRKLSSPPAPIEEIRE